MYLSINQVNPNLRSQEFYSHHDVLAIFIKNLLFSFYTTSAVNLLLTLFSGVKFF